MVDKTVVIKFKIPRWLYRLRWHNIRLYLKYRLFPPRCSCCGKKMIYTQAQYKTKNLTIDAISKDYKDKYCRECLIESFKMAKDNDRILMRDDGKELMDYQRDDVSNKCDCCGTKTKSQKFMYIDEKIKYRIHFCMAWWNGFKICPACALNVLENGEHYSSHCVFDSKNNQILPCTPHGLPVKDGKIRFPIY